MIQRGVFQYKSAFSKLITLLIIILICLVAAITISTLYTLITGALPTETGSIRVLLLIQNSFLFIVSSLLASYILWDTPIKESLRLTTPKLILLLLGCLTISCSGPFINLLHTWNQQFHLPEFMASIEQWMITAEQSAEAITNQILNASSWGELLMNVLVIAVLAGVGEELLFRGVLQKIFTEWTRNVHIAIIITAFIFSFIHFQFFGFLPRLALGILLGYLYVESKSLWVPILAHTFNNAVIVLITPNSIHQGTDWVEKIEKETSSGYYALASLIIVIALISLIRKLAEKGKRKNRPIRFIND